MVDFSHIRSLVISKNIVGAKVFLNNSELYEFVVYIPSSTTVEMETFLDNDALLIDIYDMKHYVSNGTDESIQLSHNNAVILQLDQLNGTLNANT